MGKVFTACVIAGMVAMSIGARAATFTVTCGASNSSYTFDLAHKTAGYPLPGLPYQVMPAHVTGQEISWVDASPINSTRYVFNRTTYKMTTISDDVPPVPEDRFVVTVDCH